MAGQTYSNMQPGDPCWVIVDAVNYPSGIWKGEVLAITERDGWFEVDAKITDGRVRDHRDADVRVLFDRKPTANYAVVPSNKEFDWLVRRIATLGERSRQQGSEAAVRIDTLLKAIERVTRRALSAEEAKEALLGE